jgi:hypothetical protein
LDRAAAAIRIFAKLDWVVTLARLGASASRALPDAGATLQRSMVQE